MMKRINEEDSISSILDGMNMTRNLDEEDKATHEVSTLGGNQNMTVANESGLYSLLFQMQPQKAKGVSQNEPLIEKRFTFII